MNGEYFKNEYHLTKENLIYLYGTIDRWDYIIESDFKAKRVIAWVCSDSAHVIHYDEKAKHWLEVPLLWLEALNKLDLLMCDYWRDLACLRYR